MPSKGSPLPVKWYLASVAGALLMALCLMGVFTALGGHQHTIAMTKSHAESDEDQDRQIQSVTQPNRNPMSSPQTAAASLAAEAAQPSAKEGSPPPDPKSLSNSRPKPESPRPKDQPQDEEKPTEPKPTPRPSLWSLLVSPEMIIGALSLVTLGTIIQVRRAVIAKKVAL